MGCPDLKSSGTIFNYNIRTYFIDVNLGSCFMTFGFKGDDVGVFLSTRAEFFMIDYHGYAAGKKKN